MTRHTRRRASPRLLSAEQQRVVEEIRRVAATLNVTRLSQRQFDAHHRLSGVSTAGYQFGSWNEAVLAAGLEPNPAGGAGLAEPKLTEEHLLQEIIRVHRELGTAPSERKMAKLGLYSLKPYKDRWRTFSQAREAAYQRFGRPSDQSRHDA